MGNGVFWRCPHCNEGYLSSEPVAIGVVMQCSKCGIAYHLHVIRGPRTIKEYQAANEALTHLRQTMSELQALFKLKDKTTNDLSDQEWWRSLGIDPTEDEEDPS